MEQSLYEEQISFVVKPHAQPVVMNHMKKNLTLDLDHAQMKKMKFNPGLTGPPVLSSPDLNMLKVGTPELEKMILANGMVATPTPTQAILFPKGVTEEQESYAKGFEDALKHLHNSQQVELPASSSGSSTSGAVYTNLDHQQPFNNYIPIDHDVVIKDEPQTVPSTSPPMSPIDMECQERIKLERKRQRNRVAASKCRRRKLERISRLEDKVKLLKGENTELSSVVNKLKEHVCQLKEQVMEHVQAGCQIVITTQY